jgi:Type I phosphodiesterase / nucleotide pyrophosphatase
MRRSLTAAVCAASLLLAGCGGDESDSKPGAEISETAPSAQSSPPSSPPLSTSSAAPTSEPPPPPTKPLRNRPRDVLAISIDGLNVRALDALGPAGAAAFTRLLDEGAATLDARTEVEQTLTLPNHTGMLTGRRVDADRGGHGVTWNEEIPGRTVPGPDGAGVASVFDVVHGAGGGTALFAGKTKFATFDRSWPDAIDRFEVDGDAGDLVDDVRADLASAKRRFTFLHIALPDAAGHASGWMSPAYVDAVAATDRLLGELLDTIDATPRLSRRLVVVLTADHGGPAGERNHADAGDVEDYRIPFLIWGKRMPGGDLYDLNPDYVDPGTSQPTYDGPQPVRNGDLANVVTELLGLGPVPGSELDAAQDLDWR